LNKSAAGEWKKAENLASSDEWDEVEPESNRDPVEPRILVADASLARYAERRLSEVVIER
jgi:hypothetical protein